jgi:hypothetical protein
MRESGINVVNSPADIGKTVKQILKQWNYLNQRLQL